MKNYKEFIVEMAEEMLDAEVSFYPESLKHDKAGNVTSYKLKISFADENNTTVILKDKALEKAFINFIGDAKLKKMFTDNPHAAVLHTEVYSTISNKGMEMYIYLGHKKVQVKP